METVPHIMVELQRMLDYRGVRLVHEVLLFYSCEQSSEPRYDVLLIYAMMYYTVLIKYHNE